MMETKNNKEEDICVRIVFWSFLSQLLFSVSRRLFSTLPYSTIMCAIVSFSFLVLLFLQLLLCKNKGINKRLILAVVLVTALYALSLATGVPVGKILLYYPLTIYGIVLLFIAFSIKDYKKLYVYFLERSFLLSLISVLVVFVDKSVYTYNMHFSYILLIALCFHTLNVLRNRKKKDILFILMDLLLILFYGSRGPILCYGFFLISYIVLGEQKKSIKALLSILITCLLFNIERIFSLISSTMGAIGLHSRTINLFMYDMQHTSGREIIIQDAVELIKNNPASGYGIAGQYKYMNDYPHNILLDITIHWGILFGGILIAFILVKIIKALYFSKREERILMLIFISYGLITLFFSGTYISWDGFYILLGLSFGILRNRRGVINEK